MKVCDEPGVQHEMFTEIKIEFPRVSIWEDSFWKKIFASNANALDVHCFPLLWNSDMKNQLSPFVKFFSFGCHVVFNIANRLIPTKPWKMRFLRFYIQAKFEFRALSIKSQEASRILI